MPRYQFRPAPLATTGAQVRFDTASGTNTPADITLDPFGTPIEGSIIRSAPSSGALPPIWGPNNVRTLYQKTLDYRGTPTGEVVTLTGGVSDSTIGSTVAGYDPRVTAFRGLMTNALWAFSSQTAIQGTAGTSRVLFNVLQAGTDLRLEYSGWYSATAGIDLPIPTAVPLSASVAVPTLGGLHRVTFGGLTVGTLEPCGRLVSDPIGIDFPAGQIDVRTYANSTGWYGNTVGATSTGSGGFAAGDLTAPGSGAIANSSSVLLAPNVITGTRLTPGPSVGIVGDSISVGYKDSGGTVAGAGAGSQYMAYGSGGTTQTAGPICRALTAAGIPWVNAGQIGATAQQWALSTQRRGRSVALAHCTAIIDEQGINDVNAARSLGQIQADKIANWRSHQTRAPKVFQTTITPYTTSTDGWATLGNQTVQNAGNNTTRIAFNNWLRDGAPILAGAAVATGSNAVGTLRAGMTGHPLTGVFELADLAESSRDSGLWRPGLPDDGLHPNAAGAHALSGGITVASLALA